MRFSERIKQNYSASRGKNIVGIVIAGWFLLSFVVAFFSILSDIGGIAVFFTSVGDFFGNLLFCGMFGGFMAICILIIRGCVRRIKTGSLEEYMKTLRPYGDPQFLINYADGLRDRGLGDVDLRFDDRYMAFAQKRTILIRAMDQICYLWDYGVEYQMDRRRVFVLFKNGESLTFTVKHTPYANEVLREFHDSSAFGKWIRSGDLKPDYAPFVHGDYLRKGNNNLETDGKKLILVERNKREWLSFEDVKSCYMYMVPDSESTDDYYLVLYLRDGTTREVRVQNERDGFSLYLKLLNCAPHLEYKYPTP